MGLDRTMCVVKRDGKEIGRVPHDTPNLAWKLAEIASRGAVVEYVEGEPPSAATLEANVGVYPSHGKLKSDDELLRDYWAAHAQFGPFEVGPEEYLRNVRSAWPSLVPKPKRPAEPKPAPKCGCREALQKLVDSGRLWDSQVAEARAALERCGDRAAAVDPTSRKPAGNSTPFSRPTEELPPPNKISHLEESREGEK